MRGQSAWKEHWHSAEHYAREFQYRLDTHMPLYAANYQLTNPGKGKKLDLVNPASILGTNCVELAVEFTLSHTIVCRVRNVRREIVQSHKTRPILVKTSCFVQYKIMVRGLENVSVEIYKIFLKGFRHRLSTVFGIFGATCLVRQRIRPSRNC